MVLGEIHLTEDDIGRIVNTERVGTSTNRNLEEYAELFGLSRKNFINWLNSRHNVLDIGASSGFVQKEFQGLQQKGLASPGTLIFSLDLRYALPEEMEEIEEFNSYVKRGVLKRIREFDANFRGRAVAASSHRMPFKAHSFDGIMSAASFPFYGRDRKRILQVFKEIDFLMDREKGEGMFFLAHTGEDKKSFGFNSRSSSEMEPFNLSEISNLNLHPKIDEYNRVLRLSRK